MPELTTTMSSPAGGHPWHALGVPEVLVQLGADAASGLAPDEARRRLSRVGPNRVADHPETPLWRLLLDQFRSVVVLVLLLAAAIAWALGERAESLAIMAALGLNVAIGFASEWRARRSLARLRALVVPHAVVRRGGHVVRLPSADLVPGDVIVLDAGAQMLADARLIESALLAIMEAALTGESDAVLKDALVEITPDTPLAARHNSVYLGTTVLAGRGLAVVTATGVAAELGRIGQLVALAGERTTPLEHQVDALGLRLMGLALGICGVVGLTRILHGEPGGLMLETAIGLAVAAIPEDLPAVTSPALAAGLWRLARRGALVRRLPAVDPFQAINCRSEQRHWWRLPSNGLTWAALATLIGLQWLAISLDPLARLLGTVPLATADWIALGGGRPLARRGPGSRQDPGKGQRGRPRPIDAADPSSPAREIGRDH
jgi:P-type Ca2+ transporter type 2C